VAQEERWRALFARLGVPVHQVVYEDLLTPNGFDREMRAVVRHIGRHDGIEVIPPPTRRLADELSDEWASRFQAQRGRGGT
jgi:LPS sulfotransferase NodH